MFILKLFAKLILWRFEPRVIAVTGSVGKTAALQAIQAVLSCSNLGKSAKRVRISKEFLKNPWAVIFAILGDFSNKNLELFAKSRLTKAEKLKKTFFTARVVFSSIFRFFFCQQSHYPEVLVLEYGAGRPEYIKYLLEIAKSDISVITAFGEMPAHLEFWSGPEAIQKDKVKIIEYLPAAGFAVLNADDEAVIRMKERTRAKVITFGFDEKADLRITNFENKIEEDAPFGISFKLEYGGNVVPVSIRGVLGKAQAYAAAIGACLGLIFDLNLVEISEALGANYKPSVGMRLLRGVKETYILDDSQDASPTSVHEALHTLHDLPGARKIAVLGDMLYLGKYAIEAHETIGQLAGKTVDYLITVGLRGKFIAEAAAQAGLSKLRITSYDVAAEAGKPLEDLLKKGNLVLIKGSKEMRLEKVIEEIKEIH
jgi:UDP-N-acetylmuramoyl-tripeptide--D-alanyl-D-alanine ligase